MNYSVLAGITVLSIFSTSVMSYISVATIIGPWMGPTLALIAITFLPFFIKTKQEIVIMVSAASIGGIVAVALGFSFPTIYFLDKPVFDSLLANPFLFMGLIAGLVMAAGILAHFFCQYVADDFIHEQKLAFPVGQLVYRIANSQEQKNGKNQLIAGVSTALAYAALQAKLFYSTVLIPATLTLWQKTTFGIFSVPALCFDMNVLPTYLSIGFIAGNIIAFPLLLGVLSKIFVADPLQVLFFPQSSSVDFSIAFCSGIVVSGAFFELFNLFVQMCVSAKNAWKNKQITDDKKFFIDFLTKGNAAVVVLLCAFLTWQRFGVVSQLYILVAALLSMYQITAIAGKIGLAFLGRFATFVVVPGMFLFKFDALQITLVAAFIELAGGIATEILFGYKAAQLAEVEYDTLRGYQFFGLVVSACAAAGMFYFLCTHFQLGSEQFFAQRAQGRALLVSAASFDYSVLLLGALFGFLLKRMKMNGMLVMGGLLMTFSMSVPLIIGGLISFFVRNKEQYEPFCSGVFATNALTILSAVL